MVKFKLPLLHSFINLRVVKYKNRFSVKFDEFLKALGVGMVRRRLAGSVVPINVVEIDQDGLYTIK